jgi:hypothetical protein
MTDLSNPLVYPPQGVSLEVPRKVAGEQDSLEEWFISQAKGDVRLALKIAVACCEALALFAPAGFARLPPSHKPLVPKPPPKSLP